MLSTVLTDVCAEIRNYFAQYGDRYIGDFRIENGGIVTDIQMPLDNFRYYRICGSVLNDGVHEVGEELMDEDTFHGAVWLMRIPAGLLSLAQEIADWQAKYGAIDSANMSPYSSESFGGYSYSKAQGYASAGGGMLNTWKMVFSDRLSRYRKIRV